MNLKLVVLKNFVFDWECVPISARWTVLELGSFEVTNQTNPLEKRSIFHNRDLFAIWRKGLGRARPILTALATMGNQGNPLCFGDKRTVSVASRCNLWIFSILFTLFKSCMILSSFHSFHFILNYLYRVKNIQFIRKKLLYNVPC